VMIKSAAGFCATTQEAQHIAVLRSKENRFSFMSTLSKQLATSN